MLALLRARSQKGTKGLLLALSFGNHFSPSNYHKGID